MLKATYSLTPQKPASAFSPASSPPSLKIRGTSRTAVTELPFRIVMQFEQPPKNL